MSTLIPGETASLDLSLINGTRWQLSKQQDDQPWRMVVVYRGLHCPVCKSQLKELSNRLDEMADKGISVVAASAETEARAKQCQSDWETGSLPIAYGLKPDFAVRYGLYQSNSIADKEPDWFIEPATLLFKGETLTAIWTQSTPFARPSLDDILEGISYMDNNDYPPRGNVKPGSDDQMSKAA